MAPVVFFQLVKRKMMRPWCDAWGTRGARERHASPVEGVGQRAVLGMACATRTNGIKLGIRSNRGRPGTKRTNASTASPFSLGTIERKKHGPEHARRVAGASTSQPTRRVCRETCWIALGLGRCVPYVRRYGASRGTERGHGPPKIASSQITFANFSFPYSKPKSKASPNRKSSPVRKFSSSYQLLLTVHHRKQHLLFFEHGFRPIKTPAFA